jgi:regulator of protease activity HflC (stomatin/prohibitin superfamily)
MRTLLTQHRDKLIALPLVGMAVLLGLSRCITIIPVGSIGLIDTFGQVSDRLLKPGLNLKNPLASVVTFSTQTQEIKETTSAPSKEGLMMEIDVSVLYRLDPNQAKQLYQTVGRNYQDVILLPQVRSIIRNTTGKFNAQDVYSIQRQAVAQEIRTELNQVLAGRGVIIEDTPLRNVGLPERLRQAIEAKLQADQESQRMQFVLAKEKQEAERQRIEAQGQADAQRILSQGLSEPALRFRQIEALKNLAASENAKVIILGGDGKNVLIQP